MNARISSIVAVVTLLTMTPGCTGMRNFFLGRGARCGLGAGTNYGVAPQQPYGGNACGPPATYGGQVYNGPGVGCAPSVGCGHCGEGYGSGYYGGCGCGTTYPMGSAYSTDPYMGGEVVLPYSGEVIDSTGEFGGDNFAPRTTP